MPGVGPAEHATLTAAPLSLYIHVPWCVRKCPYCDFNSHHLRGELPAAQYVDALLADLRLDLEEQPHSAQIESIFIGGGTPSLLPAAQLGRLLEGIGRQLHLPAGVEITLEANPGTIERHAFTGFRDAGVNRVSIGVQSFDDAHLRDLGRIHDRVQAEQAIAEALKVMPRVNLDLMYALPRQTLSACLEDLDRAIAFGPEHISHYELTIEPGTVFARYVPKGLPDDDLAAQMREASQAVLADAGYGAYEISAYAKGPQARSRHNLNYWHFGDYLGIGAGAHGKRSVEIPGCGAAGSALRIHRLRKVRSPRAYLEASATEQRVADREEVPQEQIIGEFMLNALRLVGGFTEALFERRTGFPADVIRPSLLQLQQEGLMRESQGGHWAPTPMGHAFTNELQARFVH